MHTSPYRPYDCSDLPLLFVAFVLSAAVTFNQHLHSENLVKIGVRKNGDLERSTKGVDYRTYLSTIMSHQCARRDLETLL